MERMENLLEVKNLKKSFQMKRGIFGPQLEIVKAVGDISFSIKKGETFGLAGESGCGKTTLSRLILGLLEADSGEILFDGIRFEEKTAAAIKKKMQVVFQDPFSSLNPRWKVRDIIAEGIRKKLIIEEIDHRVNNLLEMVGLSKKDRMKYPHQFSGGQRQRIGIARALASEPEFIVLDEPVSSLDVSVQAQVLNLLKDLQKKFDLTFLFIAHNLSIMQYFCDRIAVMRDGVIVEQAPVSVLFQSPSHPYTKLLLSCILPIHVSMTA